jgi:hypothetical protein
MEESSMTYTYILLVFIKMGYAGGPLILDRFADEQSCEAAKTKFEVVWRDYQTGAQCVPVANTVRP